MKSKTYSSEGIILSRKNYKEADRIICVFSEKYGKVNLLAKGVRKIKSRKRGHIEVFSKIKFIATKTNTFDIITEAEIISDYSIIRTSLNKMSLAYYFSEVVEKITRDFEPIPAVFSMLSRYFKELEANNNLKSLRISFLKELLLELGFWSEADGIKNIDMVIDDVLERKLNSLRVGKKILSG